MADSIPTYACFEIALEEGVAHLQLSRPEARNSMIPEFWSELPTAVNELSDSGEARALVISSTGRHFTAGMDLSVFTQPDSLFSGGSDANTGSAEAPEFGRVRAETRNLALTLQESFSCLEKARMPVLAAVQGGCVGGGVDMVSAADMRYCTADAFFCIQEINIGLTADLGTLQRLPRIIPDGLARELAYTGRRLAAEEAQAAGLVNQVYPDQDAMLKGVLEIAREIAARSPLAIWGSKEMLNYTRDHSVNDGLNYVATWQSGMFHPDDMAEVFAARTEGRDPVFQNLLPIRRTL
ncbi:MAG: crotonase/enoyl-CoA hydratase family protein [Acidimicrobiia bacterium]|nr:crotonase/enoyl-CoA hydratase family protein [Acidimicrobiia bacterium]